MPSTLTIDRVMSCKLLKYIRSVATASVSWQIIYIEDPKEIFSINHAYTEDTEVEETIIADIIITSHPVRNNTIFVINLNTSQVSI